MTLDGATAEGLGVLARVCVGSVARVWCACLSDLVPAAVRPQPAPPAPPPSPRLQATKNDRGEDDSDDTDEIDLEAEPKCHRQEAQVEPSRRHQADHRGPG